MSNLAPEIHSGGPWGVPHPPLQTPIQGNGSLPLRITPVRHEPPINVVNTPGTNTSLQEHVTKLSILHTFKPKDRSEKNISLTVKPETATEIFKPRVSNLIHNSSLVSEAQDDVPIDLSKAIITGITVTSSHNEYPGVVDVDFTGQGELATCRDVNGKQFPLRIFPGQNNTRKEIFNAKNLLDDPLLKKYGHVSVKEMWERIQVVARTDGQEVALVPPDHEALRVIALNPDRFGPPPTEADKFGGLFGMSPETIGMAIDDMFKNIVSKFKFHDLNNFKVSLTRADGRSFDDVSGTSLEHYDVEDRAFHMSKNVNVGFDLELTWATPRNNAQRARPVNVGTPVAKPVNQIPVGLYQSKIPVAAPRSGGL